MLPAESSAPVATVGPRRRAAARRPPERHRGWRWPYLDFSAIVCSVLWNRQAESVPRDQLTALQFARLRQTVARLLDSVPPMRDRLLQAGVRAPEDISS